MEIRSSRISDSILAAIGRAPSQDVAAEASLLQLSLTFLSLFHLFLACYRKADFVALRRYVWKLDEQEYRESFTRDAATEQVAGLPAGQASSTRRLQPIGDLGYSGSTFFTTANGKYLIKSLPRRFEHQFFTQDLFDPYVDHMRRHPHSLLVRITDRVYTPRATLGGILGTAPTHHIIMENLIYGKDDGGGWESYDLKPNDYFFPERDLAGGMLAPQSVKDRLVDEFPDTVKVTAEEKKLLLDSLATDTQLLAKNNAIDYSLFLVRYPGPRADPAPGSVPRVASDANSWRTGMTDVEGRWVYRVVVLDFFWARHKFHARAMTSLVKAFNTIAHRGPMTITANPDEYRERFLNMVRQIVVA